MPDFRGQVGIGTSTNECAAGAMSEFDVENAMNTNFIECAAGAVSKIVNNDVQEETTFCENVVEHFCGDMNVVCKYCSALHFKEEVNRQGAFKNCCHFGKVKLQKNNDYPEELMNIFNNKDFRSNIRSYNSAFSFASLGEQIETMSNGPYCLKIHGQVYHNTYNTNNVNENTTRRYSQLYVIDTDEACEIRKKNSANASCDFTVISNVDRILRTINPYAQAYYNMSEIERQQRRVP